MDGRVTFGRLKSKKNPDDPPRAFPGRPAVGAHQGALLGAFQAPTQACRATQTSKNVQKASPLEGALSALRGPSRAPTPPQPAATATPTTPPAPRVAGTPAAPLPTPPARPKPAQPRSREAGPTSVHYRPTSAHFGPLLCQASWSIGPRGGVEWEFPDPRSKGGVLEGGIGFPVLSKVHTPGAEIRGGG